MLNQLRRLFRNWLMNKPRGVSRFRPPKWLKEWLPLLSYLVPISLVGALWKAAGVDVTVNLRLLVIATGVVLVCLIAGLQVLSRRYREIGKLKKDNEELRRQIEGQTDQNKAGKYEVDGIVWQYVWSCKKSEWTRFVPLCKHCDTQLRVKEVPDFYGLSREECTTRYYCDFCEKFDVSFRGTEESVEDKAQRHIVAQVK